MFSDMEEVYSPSIEKEIWICTMEVDLSKVNLFLASKKIIGLQ